MRFTTPGNTPGLHGHVVEIGFGSGLNVAHYPDAVTRVAAVEPADTGWKLAGKRLHRSDVPIERTGPDGQSLPLPDDSVDTALSTWTLCTIPDEGAALAELRRVLKPGGSLHFVEHGLASDQKVQRLQRRLEPLQMRVAGGCHLTRRIPELLTSAGFTITELDAFYGRGPRRSSAPLPSVSPRREPRGAGDATGSGQAVEAEQVAASELLSDRRGTGGARPSSRRGR